MSVAIGAGAVFGVAIETVSGVYTAPQKFSPFESETLKYVPTNIKRRSIRNTPGLIGVIPGNTHIEGDLVFEITADLLPYFLHASRCTVVKTGAGPYVYTYTPSPIAVPVKTLSISIKKNAEVFGYVGCIVGGFTITVGTDGVLKTTVKIVGNDEATQAALTTVWPTTVPFGPGQYTVEIPTATQVFDTDTFEFVSEDNAAPQFRLKNSGRGASFAKFGESNGTMKVERDFADRTDYDTFKALTAQSIHFKAQQDASNIIDITMPVAYKDSFDINIPNQGDLIRAVVMYEGAIDSTGKHYSIIVTTTENIV